MIFRFEHDDHHNLHNAIGLEFNFSGKIGYTMNNLDEHLKQYIREQIALEEHLSTVIEQQISEVSETEFADAKNVLIQTREVLERHFIPLNALLDKLEKDTATALAITVSSNGSGNSNGLHHHPGETEQRSKRISTILRDDYSALNLVAISNTLLHTTALALNCQEVAAIALSHLQNLTPLVVKIGQLVPEVVARELRTQSPEIDLAIAQIALKNTQLAWRTAG